MIYILMLIIIMLMLYYINNNISNKIVKLENTINILKNVFSEGFDIISIFNWCYSVYWNSDNEIINNILSIKNSIEQWTLYLNKNFIKYIKNNEALPLSEMTPYISSIPTKYILWYIKQLNGNVITLINL